ncbi:BspA family leucine-rich repeat surface protein, partial [Enterococcus avium]|uniref:BspA family leucine-rich repeat surface protein n=1 Tax=Enterococcus avium TaxID=33945 RepID=UPI0037BA19F0
MKKKKTAQRLKAGERQHRFVFKKVNKQLISVVGTTLLLLGNYGLMPIQVFATETATTQASEPLDPDKALPTLATEEPTEQQNTEREPIQAVESEPTEMSEGQRQTTEPTKTTDSSAVSEEESKVEKQEPKQQVTSESDWDATFDENSGYMVINSYSGDGVIITVPSEIEGKPVQVDLKSVLGETLKTTTKTFQIQKAKDGLAPVKLVGSFNSLFMEYSLLQTVSFGDADTSSITDMYAMFSGCKNLTELDLSSFNTQNVENMGYMFEDCSMTELDLSSFNTQSVKSMRYMIDSCSSLKKIILSSFDTQNVKDMEGMFYNCNGLTELDLSSFNTQSVTNMSFMFSRSSITELDLSSFNTQNVENISYMFSDCDELTKLDLSSFNTQSVKSMSYMFSGCSHLPTLLLTKNFIFKGTKILGDLPADENEGKTTAHWVKDDYAEVYDSTADFVEGHNALPSSDDTVHTYTIQKKHLVTFNLDGGSDGPIDEQKVFDNQKVREPTYEGTKGQQLFVGWTVAGKSFAFETPITEPLELTAKWLENAYTVQFHSNTGEGTMDNQVFEYDEEKSLTPNKFSKEGYIFAGWNTQEDGKGTSYDDQASVKNLTTENGGEVRLYAQWKFVSDWTYHEVDGCMVIDSYTGDSKYITVPSEIEGKPVQVDLESVLGTTLRDTTESFQIEKAKDGLAPVKLVGSFNSLFKENSKLQTASFADADTSSIADMNYMFYKCGALSTLDLSSFNTQNVTKMNYMFYNCSSLISIDLSSFNTQKVTEMYTMFYGCKGLTELDLSSFDTEKVTNMGYMFYQCSSLSTLDLSVFDTRNAKIMSYMFYDCYNLNTLNVGSFNTQLVTDMEHMFSGCRGLTELNLRRFNTQAVTNMYCMFTNCSSLSTLDLSSFNTQNVTNMYSMFSGCSNLSTLNLSTFDTRSATRMSSMFSGCSSLCTLNLSTFDTQSVTSMSSMFFGCSSLSTLNLSTFDTRNVTGMSHMFYGCNSLSTLMLTKSFNFKDGHSLRELPTAENEGKTTTHWVKDNYSKDYDSTTDFVEGHNALSSSDDTVHTYTIQKRHLVTFNLDGGSDGPITEQKVFDNQKVINPNYKGTKDHYRFDGWMTTGEEFDFDKSVTMPLVLTAKWIADTYTVVFDSNGGTGKMAAQEIIYGEPTNLTENSFTREGYKFIGWNTQKDGKGISYDDEASVEKIIGENGEKIALYAQWQPVEYTVTFDSAGGSVESPLTYTIEQGITAFPTPTKKGYTFQGWYEDDKKVESIEEGQTGDRVLKAEWQTIEYKITFDDPDVSPIDYTIESDTINLPTLTKKGYIFFGWIDENQVITEVVKGSTGNKTLKVKWQAVDYTVVFNSNGGTGEMVTQEMTYDKAATLTENAFTRKGYTFNGWNTQKDGKGTAYSDKVSVKNLTAENDGEVPLYAQWKVVEYIVAFDSEGGSTVDSLTYTIEKGIDSLPMPIKEGYVFQGWYEGEKKVESIEKGQTGDQALKAKWQAVEYTVTFDSTGGSTKNPLTYTIEQGIAEFPTPTKKGYTFQGWYEDDKKVESIEKGQTGDQALKAKWQAVEYTVTFDSTGGSTK